MSDEPIRIRGFACTRGRGCEHVDVTYASLDAMRAAAEPFSLRQGSLFGDDLPPEKPTRPAEDSKITPAFERLVRDARRTGQDQRVRLAHGAELVVRVAGGKIAFRIKRTGAPVSADEERTFRRDCRVPPDARRIPEFGIDRIVGGPRVADAVYCVGFVWEDTEEQTA